MENTILNCNIIQSVSTLNFTFIYSSSTQLITALLFITFAEVINGGGCIILYNNTAILDIKLMISLLNYATEKIISRNLNVVTNLKNKHL